MLNISAESFRGSKGGSHSHPFLPSRKLGEDTKLRLITEINIICKSTNEMHQGASYAKNRSWIECESAFDVFDEFGYCRNNRRAGMPIRAPTPGPILPCRLNPGEIWYMFYMDFPKKINKKVCAVN
jgi:hypothetical protein